MYVVLNMAFLKWVAQTCSGSMIQTTRAQVKENNMLNRLDRIHNAKKSFGDKYLLPLAYAMPLLLLPIVCLVNWLQHL